MRVLWTIGLSMMLSCLLFAGVVAPAAAATDSQLSACRNRVMQQYPGTYESNIGASQIWEANGSVRIDWYNGPGRAGSCVIGPRNELYEFIVNGQRQPTFPGNGGNNGNSMQSFGNIPSVGQFAAVNGSGRFQNGIVLFQAYVNGNGPTQWGARCSNGRLLNGGNGGEVRDSQQARYVVAYVCNGGPPVPQPNGTVGFGSVPGIGQFSVVNGSGHGTAGVVFFQAYVSGAGPQNWMTSCATGQLGQNGGYVQYSPQAQYVSSYICNGGPPGGGWYR